MTDCILALNAGSSNLKCALFEMRGPELAPLGRRVIEGAADAETVAGAISWAEGLRRGARLAAVGHRVVHGGPHFRSSVRLDGAVIAALEALTPMAPLHQPQSLAAIRAVGELHPHLEQIACFDTTFHAAQPEVATRFGIPRDMHERGLRRYGFHGLSYQHVAERLEKLSAKVFCGRVLVAHLGSGASLCAMRNGRSVDTTMGFSPLDGLVMSARPGALDPGLVLYLQDQEGFSAKGMVELLYHHCGLLGVSGVSGDMRDLLESDAPEAKEAIELFVYRIGREAGALVSSLGGLDGVVFTGGIGENSAEIRALAAARMSWLGLELDWQANALGGEGRISSRTSRVPAWIVAADEERIIAREALGLLRTHRRRA